MQRFSSVQEMIAGLGGGREARFCADLGRNFSKSYRALLGGRFGYLYFFLLGGGEGGVRGDGRGEVLLFFFFFDFSRTYPSGPDPPPKVPPQTF